MKEEMTNNVPINVQDVIDAQERWGEAILRIGRVYTTGGDARAAADAMLDTLYAYRSTPGGVHTLFKPTLARTFPFRLDHESARSYFIGRDRAFPEDTGFALRCWTRVRWERAGIRIMGDVAVSMGRYYFMDPSGIELAVEFSFVYQRHGDTLKIILHDSHLPYAGAPSSRL